MTDNAMRVQSSTANKRMILASAAMTSANRKQRLSQFVYWLDQTGQLWYNPDLSSYRDYLLSARGLSPSSVQSYLGTIRGRLAIIAKSNDTRDVLFDLAPSDDLLERKAFVDETIIRLQNALNPTTSKVSITVEQDIPDSEHIRLSRIQANHLMVQPGTDTLLDIRDTVIITLMLCTGIRESELCSVKVSDLRQTKDGELALLIPKGKGNKQRMIPYGGLVWCLDVVDSWLHRSGITEGFAFRGVYRGGKRIRNTPITKRAINQMLGRYPVMYNGKMTIIQPHDLRRSYAKIMYDSGMAVLSIRDNLGHASLTTTERYIGLGDMTNRLPANVLQCPL